MKYCELLNEWLQESVKPTVKKRTYDRYDQLVRCHLKPALGECHVEELTELMLRKYVSELSENGNLVRSGGLSHSTVNIIITVIQNSLKYACSAKKIKKYVAGGLIRPKLSQKKIEVFTVSEQRKLERVLLNEPESKMFGVVLCLYTGMRVGELLALKWENVDVKNGTIEINGTCYDDKSEDGGYKRVIGTPKTLSSCRLIPLPRQIIPLLCEHGNRRSSEFVIVNEFGRPIGVRSYQKSFEILLECVGIKKRCFHALRHTFATRALECGMDVKTLSEILGHHNATVTLNRYAHSLIEHKKEMMNRVGKLLWYR